MYSLDSDTIRALYDSNPNVLKRLSSVPPQDIWVSAIVLTEAIAGRMSNITAAYKDKSPNAAAKLAKYFDELLDTVFKFQSLQIIPYTEDDEHEYRKLKPNVIRRGPSDCRIAVQAHRRGYVIVTLNVRDLIPICDEIGATCENWSTPSNPRAI